MTLLGGEKERNQLFSLSRNTPTHNYLNSQNEPNGKHVGSDVEWIANDAKHGLRRKENYRKMLT